MTSRNLGGTRIRTGRADARSSGDVPAAAAQVATVGPWGMVAMGLLFGGVSMIFDRFVGGAFLGVCLVGSVVLFAAADRVRKLSRWTAGSSVAGTLVFAGGLCTVGGAIAIATLDGWTLLWAACVFGVAAALIWRRGVRRREAEWEHSRAVNEGQVLDLSNATYDASRNFVYESPTAPSAGGRFAQAVPWIAVGSAIAAGAGRYAGHDLREYFLMVAGPVVFLGALPALALVVTTWRKIRVYERQIGRDIVNR